MDFSTRKSIIEQLEIWEEDYPVDLWMINGIHIWPLVKMRFFNDQFNRINKKKSSGKSRSKISLVLSLILETLTAAINLVLVSFRLQKVNYIYSGGIGHRALDQNGVSVNRYFDYMMDNNADEGKTSLLLEYDKLPDANIYKPERVVAVAKLLSFFIMKEIIKFRKREESLGQFNLFLKEIVPYELDPKLFENTIRKQTLRINAWKQLFFFFLRKTKSEKAFGLCYYANPVFGMILSGKQAGIPSVDMQHGTQGTMHPVYTYSKVPEMGYNIVPDYFYCWDDISFRHIKSWSPGNGVHEPVLFGNTWKKFVLQHQKRFSDLDLSSYKKIVLVTLQPLQPVIDDYLVETMERTINEYTWWIRIHPRMNKTDINELHSKFSSPGIKKKIVFDDAQSIPLPLVLSFTKIHISKYSGSISEAASMNVKTIITDKIGLESYGELLISGLGIDGVGDNQHSFESLLKSNV